MAGAGRVRRSRRLREAPVLRAARAAGVAPEEWRDWAGGLPAGVLEKVAATHVAQTVAGWAAHLKGVQGWSEERIQEVMEERERDGKGLFVFAMVCRGWRKAQLEVGGPLRTRVESDVAMSGGGVALAKWALAEGCPREGNGFTMAAAAAQHGHLELVQCLVQEHGFAMDDEWMANGNVIENAALGGNLEVVRWLRGEGCDWSAHTCSCAAQAGQLGVLQWLRAEGCPWDEYTCKYAAFGGHLETLRWACENGCDWNEACESAAEAGRLEVLQWLRTNGCPWDAMTCYAAVDHGHVEVLRWARANGCPWDAEDRDRAAAELGYTDDLGNLVDYYGNPVQ